MINEQKGEVMGSFHGQMNLPLQNESFLVSHRSCSLADVKTLSFSQKRFNGFRNFYEFEQKRILLANENKIKILSYQTTDIARGTRFGRSDEVRGPNSAHLPDPDEQTSAFLCCGSSYVGKEDVVEPAMPAPYRRIPGTPKAGPTESTRDATSLTTHGTEVAPI